MLIRLFYNCQISRWVQVGAFFLVIHSLVSTLGYGYVPTQPYFFSNSKTYSKLPIPFNDSLRISLCLLRFIYLVGATLDINTTHSTCNVSGNISHKQAFFTSYPATSNSGISLTRLVGLQAI